ncbi:MAG: hypothetical protein ACRC2B_17330 [Rubrivivax sp.]
MPLTWSVEGDVLTLGSLHLAVQRIGRSHWGAGVPLRSWGPSPLHLEGLALHLPCAADEALWLGAWLEPDDTPAPAVAVALHDPARAATARIVLPAQTQLATLDGPDGPRPIARDPRHPDASAQILELEVGDARAQLSVVLEDPMAWAARAGRPPPPPLRGPPPLPPRLG